MRKGHLQSVSTEMSAAWCVPVHTRQGGPTLCSALLWLHPLLPGGQKGSYFVSQIKLEKTQAM